MEDLRAALPAWVAARLVVAATLAGATSMTLRIPMPEPVRRHVSQGLLGWDAERYVQIAERGYAALPRVELRFFPVLPLAVRLFDGLLPGGAGVALLVVANLAALAFGAVLHHLALVETADRALARRAAWMAAITPAGFVLVWGYSEALWGLLATGAVLAARRRRWWIAAALGLAVGGLRPVGLLVCLPLAIECVRDLRTRRRLGRAWAPRLAAVAAPVAGAGAYLWWVGTRFGDPLLPYTIQQGRSYRGAAVDPFTALSAPFGALLRGEFSLESLRVVWALVLVTLVVVCWRRWPASYAALAAAAVAVALCTTRLGSFERYGFTTFPIPLALATVSARPLFERIVLVLGGATMGVYGLLALLGGYVP
ncbi:MAG: hypothetical protein KY439_08720 [Actinobacteria bacterium]|nr:hypothetical protein [Actinomycetota bacterium]